MKLSRREFLSACAGSALGFGLAEGFIYDLRAERRRFDLLLRGALLIDGRGNKPYQADVGIIGDKIAAIGELAGNPARQTIDLGGLCLAPGFVDIHSHTDEHLIINPRAESKIRQGVTTEVTGNCGYSMAPVVRRELQVGDALVQVDWKDFAQYFKRLESGGLALNYATLVGHGTLRAAAMGEEDRPPRPRELEKMKRDLELALRQGAFGLSTGLEYTPGSFARPDELVELNRVVRRFRALYATHMRNEGNRLLEAIDEALLVAKRARVRLEISHLKTEGRHNWKKIDRAFSAIERARQEGLDVNFDRYPYTAFSTGMGILFPLWAREGGAEKFISRLSDPALLDRIKGDVFEKMEEIGAWDAVIIAAVRGAANKKYEGKNLVEAARERNLEPFEFARRLMIEEKGEVSIVAFAMDEGNLKRILAHPLGIVASDGTVRADYGPLAAGKPHPRSYGTFPRVLGKYVREEKAMSLEEAVKKMTWLPASKVGLRDRGSVAIGKFADLVLFDPNAVRDTATFADPHQYPEGIKYVFVNGVAVIENGDHTGKLAGRVLRRGA